MDLLGLSLDEIIKKDQRGGGGSGRRNVRGKRLPRQVPLICRLFLYKLIAQPIQGNRPSWDEPNVNLGKQPTSVAKAVVQVSNLHYSVLQPELKVQFFKQELFSQYEGLICCEIDWDEIGRSKVDFLSREPPRLSSITWSPPSRLSRSTMVMQ